MAQYTPNFNLYQPDATDPIEDFRSEFNANMGIIDNNLGGGGGSGGHTIYDENGSAMTQRTGLEFKGKVQVTDDSVNDKTIVDILGGNVYGAFINPDKIVYAQQINSGSQTYSSWTYTATEDCFFVGNTGKFNGSNVSLTVDGKTVANFSSGFATDNISVTSFLRKGQVAEFSGLGNWANCRAYGLLQGTNGIFAPVIYSDTERCIGIWRDNKPLYQKTYQITTPSTLNDSVQVQDISALNVDTVVNLFGHYHSSINWGLNIYFNTSRSSNVFVNGAKTYISMLVNDNATLNQTAYVTIQYTKTTDVAGSGDWNTDGVPTVHYSTNEQVVGTWIDGSTIYECVYDLGSDLTVPNNAWTYAVAIPNIDKIIDINGQYSSGSFYPLMAYHSGNDVYILASRVNASASVRYLIMRYTKTA